VCLFLKKLLAIIISALLIIPVSSFFVNAADLSNVAKGKTYTVDIGEGTPGYSCPDPDDGTGFGDGVNAKRQRLTDGVIGADDGGLKGLIGAQQTAKAVYIIDLGSVVNGIKKLSMDLYYGNWGIGEALSVEYALSTDNTNFNNVGKVERKDAVNKVNAVWKGDDYVLNLSEAKSARYVKITATATNYVWSSEMQVFAEGGSAGNSSSQASSNSSSAASSSKAASSAASSSKAASSAASSSSQPKTGDNNSIAIFAVIAVLSMGTAYAVAKRTNTVSKSR
jgi:LPXTG-motif cell wall-anchored protein